MRDPDGILDEETCRNWTIHIADWWDSYNGWQVRATCKETLEVACGRGGSAIEARRRCKLKIKRMVSEDNAGNSGHSWRGFVYATVCVPVDDIKGADRSKALRQLRAAFNPDIHFYNEEAHFADEITGYALDPYPEDSDDLIPFDAVGNPIDEHNQVGAPIGISGMGKSRLLQLLHEIVHHLGRSA